MNKLCLVLIVSHADFVENLPEPDGAHITSSLLDGWGTMEAGIACFRLIRSGELATGHRHWPLDMMEATLA